MEQKIKEIMAAVFEVSVDAIGEDLRGQNSRWTWGVSRSNLTMI